jgi:hypothetical protein
MIRRFPVRISALTDERDVDGVAQALAPFDVIDLVGRAQRSLCGLVDWGRFSVPVNAQHCPLGESVASERIGVDLELHGWPTTTKPTSRFSSTASTSRWSWSGNNGEQLLRRRLIFRWDMQARGVGDSPTEAGFVSGIHR